MFTWCCMCIRIFTCVYMTHCPRVCRKELDDNMDNVIVNSPWAAPDKTATFKTPTHLLLNEKREFEAFGYDSLLEWRHGV